METQGTDLPINRDRNLTKPAALDRLLAMMAHWWDGWTMSRIGRAYGISRQRVGDILAKVGCTRALWRMADHARPDSNGRGWRHGTEKARKALLHPLAHRLTVRQRAALAWQAQGLALPDIARRMLATSQNVRGLQVAAHWRLERLARTGPDQGEDPANGVNDLDWSDVVRPALLLGRRLHRLQRSGAGSDLTSGQNVQKLTNADRSAGEHPADEQWPSDRNNAPRGREALAK